jgi:hypothetical protein
MIFVFWCFHFEVPRKVEEKLYLIMKQKQADALEKIKNK